MKYDVFISYSRKDSELVTHICKELTKNNISFFVDKSFIKIGNDFPEVIADAILNSRIFLFIASENSYASNFTNSEIAFAHKHKSKDSIIPYIIDESSLPIGLDLVLSSTDYKTATQYSADELCKELSNRINTQPINPKSDISVKLLTKYGYWILFAILSYWICSSCVNSLKFSVSFEEFTNNTFISNTILWICVCGFWGVFSIGTKILHDSLVQNNVMNYSIGLLSALIYGTLVTAPCMTHSLYLHFQLKTDIRAEISTLHSHILPIANGNSEIKQNLEKIDNLINYEELDVFDSKDATIIRNTINESYTYLKEHYSTDNSNITIKQYYTKDYSKIEDIYNLFKIWKSQLKDGIKIEFALSLVISIIIIMISTLLITKKL
ncbi:MAG: toll/interleukin-1 receptor domain-containing protein [Alistipes sp.]|nr:toll/interleukin-1 receptor domain-containing protein [Alistipes sp.]